MDIERGCLTLMNFLSERIADFYLSKNIIQPDEKEVYKCGVELILNDIVTFSIILILSALIWHLRYGIEYLTVFCFTRIYCGGYHASKAYLCRLTMIVTFLGVILLSGLLSSQSHIILYILLILSFVAIFPLIPVKHPNKELTDELIKKGRRNGSFAYILFSIVSSVFFECINHRDGLIIALTLSAVTVLAYIGVITNERRCFHEQSNG